jgi:hypothetical protein
VRSSPPTPHARHHIDLLDPTLHHVLSGPGTPDLLRERANAGCQIRLLLSAPDSAHLVLADREHGEPIDLLDIPDSAREAERSLTIAEALTATDGVQARTYIAASPHTLLRFDDDLLLAIHLYSVAGDEAPLLHLKRHSDHGLFQRFTAHYQALWDDAQPLTPPSPAS